MVVSTRLKLSLNAIEAKCLQLWMVEVSNQTMPVDREMQEAMQNLLEKIEHEIKMQQPQWDCKFDYGDF